ncbi:MAG: 2,3-bisphosphoglycerate-independent phosphoglycerate mutase [Candidatus Zixiibacteriota bacterium]|nr:MAG: 2,3-bisphosphoglycerate-independent phosphoglycerate mutase [candidate division Zixibacteria bacterium]
MFRRDRVILVIMDGLGISQIPNDDTNAFKQAHTPNLDDIWRSYPMGLLRCSGRAVGLPEGQMGNSEVGHQNMGAGRVVYQDITRIDVTIESGEFRRNAVLQETLAYARERGVTLHLIGLHSDGGVHSSLQHLYAILGAAREAGLEDVAIHALMDGRDTPPTSGIDYIRRTQTFISQMGVGRLATVMGRYYGMDRDNRWERVQLAYDALVKGEGLRFSTPEEAVESSYRRGVTDEFIVPSVIVGQGGPSATVKDGDAVIFFNFRADRARELTRAFTEPGFSAFPVVPLKLRYATMTQYHQSFTLPVLFPPQMPVRILGEVVSQAGLTQLRLAETEKYAHVTFFLNGGEERVFPGEDRILVPSPKVPTYDLQPEMSAPEVTRQAVAAIESEKYNLIVMNYANCDMVGHSGILEAAVKAVEAVDQGVGQVRRAAFDHGYVMILTADHGNCEMMVDPATGGPFTAHTLNPVPLFLLDAEVRLLPRPEGRLCEIAPTVLQLLGLPQPPEMDCQSLVAEGEEP